MSYWQDKRAVIVGGSSGLGRAVAVALAERGARVVVVARGEQALDDTVAELRGRGGDAHSIVADVTSAEDVARLGNEIAQRWGGVDLVCHAAGSSMRGDALSTPPEKFRELWELNFLSAVRTVQQFADSVAENSGHVVLVGSLAGKCAPRYLGAYPTSKFPLAALAQQLRMELGSRGVHTLLVSPGPVARGEAALRYADEAADLPPGAQQPGGGARLKAISAERLAERILRACERRQAELVVPSKTKLLFALAQLWPTLGDWILRKNTEQAGNGPTGE